MFFDAGIKSHIFWPVALCYCRWTKEGVLFHRNEQAPCKCGPHFWMLWRRFCASLPTTRAHLSLHSYTATFALFFKKRLLNNISPRKTQSEVLSVDLAAKYSFTLFLSGVHPILCWLIVPESQLMWCQNGTCLSWGVGLPRLASIKLGEDVLRAFEYLSCW